MKLKAVATAGKETGLKGTNFVWRVGLLVNLTGLIVYIIGFSTNQWVNGHKNAGFGMEYSTNFGLWRKCVKKVWINNGTVLKDFCQTVDNSKPYIPAAKVLCSVGLIFCFCGLLLSLFVIYRHYVLVNTISGVLLIVGAMLATVGAGVYAGKVGNEQDNVDAGYSVFFALVGCILLTLGSGLQMIFAKKDYTSID
ncbi:hypothetical protein Btru_041775 [Bulinus truncatus]|nr:hypothetical protein Btru_041775 [Bulinus truncatus]